MYGKSILLMEPRLNLTNVLKSFTIIILIITTATTIIIITIIISIINGFNSSSIMRQLVIVNISTVASGITFFPPKYSDMLQ